MTLGLYTSQQPHRNTPSMPRASAVRVENSLGWFRALKRASVQAELHIFAEGGHGYGILRSGRPVAGWPLLAAGWLRRQADMP